MKETYLVLLSIIEKEVCYLLGQSSFETQVYNILTKFTSFEIIRNTYKIIRNPITNKALELDLFIPDLMLAVEVDGPMHRVPCYGEERLKAQLINDKIKDELCFKQNIILVRLNTDIITDLSIRTTLSEAIRNVTSNSSSIERATTNR